MKYLEENKNQYLQFLIAGYENKLVYHEYSNGNLNAGKQITEDSLKSIFKILNPKFVDFETAFEFKGLIPKNVLKFSTDEKKIIWYTPETIKKLYFKEDLPIETACYPVPTLLWKLSDNELNVYALDSIPKDFNANLYHAPFFNVSSLGVVCMGNTKFIDNNTDYEKIISLAETAFFNSYFTHSSHNNLIKSNYVEYMNKLKTDKILKFDKKELYSSHKTIKELF